MITKMVEVEILSNKHVGSPVAILEFMITLNSILNDSEAATVVVVNRFTRVSYGIR